MAVLEGNDPRVSVPTPGSDRDIESERPGWVTKVPTPPVRVTMTW